MLKKVLLALFALFASIGMAMAAVNINTATEQELGTLPGIGDAKAKAIVEYRKANGNFKSTDDLKKVKGIGDKVYDKLKSQVTVSGATTTEPSVADKTKAAAKSAGAEAKADAKKAKEAVKEKAADAKDAVKEKAAEAKAETKSAAKEAKADAKKAASSATSAAKAK